MSQDAHIMFPISAEFKAQLELAAEDAGMTLAGYIKTTMAGVIGYDYSASTGATRKYANADERKAAQKEAAKAKRALVGDLIEQYKAQQRAKAAGEASAPLTSAEKAKAELEQAERVKAGQEAARKAEHEARSKKDE